MTSFKRKNLAGGFVELSRSIEPDNTQWLPIEFGILVFQKDYGKKGYFFRLYDLESNTKSNDFVWELEMYTPFKYHQLNDSFHYIPDDGYYVGFNFTVPEQAKKFLQVVTQTQKARDELYKNKKVIKLKKTESQVSIPYESKIKKRAFSIKNTIVESKFFSNLFGLRNKDKDKTKVENSKSNMSICDKKSKINIKENNMEEKVIPKKTTNKTPPQSTIPVKQTGPSEPPKNTLLSPATNAPPPPPPPTLGNIPPPPPLLKIDSSPPPPPPPPSISLSLSSSTPPPPPPPPSIGSSISSPPPPPPPIDGPKLPAFLNDISSFNSAKLKKTETVDKSVLNFQKSDKKEVTSASSNNKKEPIAAPVDPNEALLSSIRQFKGFNKKPDDAKKNEEKKLPLKPKSFELKDQLKDILASRQPFLQQSSDESDSDVEW
ncbi:unnamed protein product [Brachionus calyciflorus]|uniref:WH1 domain-containing protein n=1 Tax=Brachionus calyciflorus TaxID=104777 RepID=A0A813Q915_9BILA|nr:unnamed protein product [Brachionus calyciflorus]